MNSPPFAQALLDAPVFRSIAEAYTNLPRLQQRFADYVLRRPFDVATGSIEEVALAADVSVATANRFASLVGYEGYPSFRADLLKVFKTVIEPVERLRNFKPGARLSDTIGAVLAQSTSNLSITQDMLDAGQCDRMIQAVSSAERVYVVGFGSSSLLAQSASYLFDPYCANVHVIGGMGGAEQAVRRLSQLSSRDFVFGISFPRYSADTVRLLDFARQQGAIVAALTDSPLSPLVNLVDCVLYARADNGPQFNSNVAGLALLEGIAAALAQGRGQDDAVRKARDLTEQLMPYFYLSRTDASSMKKATTKKRGKK
jgi:DNA-binding MurR/RpiR family transcriptional regulator